MSINQNVSPETTGSKLGKYIKYQRVKRKYSLNEFARKINVTTSFLLRLERGDYASVSFDIIEKIAIGFEMTVEDFLQKCKVITSSDKLPPIDYYLKEMYQFPKEAIEDFKLLIQLLNVKYKKQITELKKIHKDYWKK